MKEDNNKLLKQNNEELKKQMNEKFDRNEESNKRNMETLK